MSPRHFLAAVAVAALTVFSPAKAADISASDQQILTVAIKDGETRNWADLMSLSHQASNKTVAAIVRWRYLIDRESNASFQDLYSFMEDHPNWPNASAIQRNAEHAMPPDMSADEVLAFFKKREPLTGEGMLMLGIAKLSAGDTVEGPIWIRRGYVAGSFSAQREAQIRTEYAKYLPADADRLRLSSLLWEDDFTSATRMLGYVDSSYRALGQARLKLRTNTGGAQKFIDAVPSSLRSDPGLLFDMGRWYRRSNQAATGAKLMAQAIRDPATPLPLDKWWDEKSAHVRQALKDGRYKDAYAVAASAGLTDGADFAEAEFISGWMQLRFLNNPRVAFDHFNRIAPGVTTPISRSRGHYWTARTRAILGDNAGAETEYGFAAREIETFYGQLAMAHLNPRATLTIDLDTSVSRGDISTFDRDDLVKALDILASVGDTKLFPRFVGALGEGLQKRADFETASALLMQLGRTSMAVRVAKKAMQKEIHVFRYAYPIMKLPSEMGNISDPPEAALVLAFMRMETEFDPNARSDADARGIMQLLPSTAKLVASKHGIPYDASRLMGDANYNATLGMAYLYDLLNQFNGSYLLTAVAYNAGPGRVSQWIAAYGDPRSPGVDPVDWIERIPFSETRNYVMRILDATNVYRAVLNGGSAPLQIETDLLRGSSQTRYRPS